MHLYRYPKIFMYKSSHIKYKPNLDVFHNTCMSIATCNIIKRKFYSSTYLLVRGIRKDAWPQKEKTRTEKADSLDLRETNVSPKNLLDEAVTFEGDSGSDPLDRWTSDPYKSLNKLKRQEERSQGKNFIMPKGVNPQETSIILFPGQGTQFVGMGKKLLEYPNVKKMYEQASEVLEYDILKLSCEGPAEDLNQTKYQQPAIFLASLAAVEKLRYEQPSFLESCIGTAGFSVGEIAALTFAGAINFWNAVQLVKVRAEAMQIASEMNRSGMITVFYQPDSRVNFACSVAKEYCQKIGVENPDCRIANFLFPSCKVIGGNEEALEFIIKNKDDFKIKKIMRLNVSGAFHTDLMKPAAFVFKEALENVTISLPAIPVYSNLDGRPYKNVQQIWKRLPKQIYYPVRWEQTLHVLYEKGSQLGFPMTFECGPGASLKTILKMVNRKAWEHCSNVDV